MFLKKKQLPELYSPMEMEAIEDHIGKYFGKFDNVFHEIMSPDIHVDICIVDPTPERDHYTLVTMGMGAHKMKVPRELRGQGYERAEILVALPPDWKINDKDERWYWPIRWLKVLARLPGEHDTWLGYGHTVPNDGPFADNTKLCCALLTLPYIFDPGCAACVLPNGDEVNFYQMVPLYEDERDFKINNDTEELESHYPEDFDMVVDIKRESFLK